MDHITLVICELRTYTYSDIFIIFKIRNLTTLKHENSSCNKYFLQLVKVQRDLTTLSMSINMIN